MLVSAQEDDQQQGPQNTQQNSHEKSQPASTVKKLKKLKIKTR